MKEKSHLDLKLINKNTGKEEIADLSLDRPFHGTAMFQGEVLMYGIKWEVYTPAPLYLHLGIRKWNYNSGVSDILTNCIIKATPGNFMQYFHYPPWLLGSSYAPPTIAPGKETYNECNERMLNSSPVTPLWKSASIP